MVSNYMVLSEVGAEMNRARIKFPGNRHMLAALIEEVGELSNALLEQHKSGAKTDRDIFTEAIHVAATALRIAVEGDKDFEKYNPANGLPTEPEAA